MANIFLRASADFVIRLRGQPGFVDLIDTYAMMAEQYTGDSDLRYHTGRAVRKATFEWGKFAERRIGSFSDPTAVETLEISDACGELAVIETPNTDLSPEVFKSRPNPVSNKINTPMKGKN